MWPLPQCYAVISTIILQGTYLLITGLSKQLMYCLPLIIAMFQYHPAIHRKMLFSLQNNHFNISQTLFVRNQRTFWLSRQIWHVLIIGINIWRIRYDHIKKLAA